MKTIVEIPNLPDTNLNPNKRVHWGALADAKRNAKQVMMSALKDNDNPVFIPDKPYESAILKIEFVAGFRDRQRKNRDMDNLLASAKPYIDGLVDGGVIVDDTAVRLRYELVYRFGEEAKMVFTVTKKRRQF
tara:strand:+ start:116 stop:511 length:396 start_codon:yes stop_codon:yes gene_type:complete